MKQSISKCLGFLADNEYQGESLDESDRCRIGMIVCKAIKREVDVDWYSEHGQAMAGPGDIIAALYHWAHDYGCGQWSDTYALGCAAGQIYDPNGNDLEPDSMEATLYLDWTHQECTSMMRVCSDCHDYAHMGDLTWLDGKYTTSQAVEELKSLEHSFKKWEGHTKRHEPLLDVDHSIYPCDLCGATAHGERKGMVTS